ncbi:glucose-1-phosphate thymidylyltransferase [Aquihabitans sp. McL0605]|uniref:glucose-1-phosphate thymidylyltransferase n=1 Tax=Aquihabitans sp. McL0605 TaxID=3415671 RepID=UPI003CEE9996
MKGLILAGGKGTRLRPITHTSAKQLVPVANKPILFYAIETVASAGIDEIGIIVGDTAAEVQAACGDGSQFGVTLTYILQDEALGLAHCVRLARSFLGDDDFVMFLGDNLLEEGLSGFAARFEEARRRADTPSFHDDHAAPAAWVLLAAVPDPHQFGVAEIGPDGEIVRLVEKPAEPASNLAMVGAYFFTPAIHDAVAAIEPSARGELEITDAVQWLIDRGDVVRHDLLSGWWLDTGKKDSVLDANRRVLETLTTRIDGHVDDDSRIDGRVVIDAGATVTRSTVRGPVSIGPGAEITNSYVGPFTSIGSDVTVVDSEVEGSVLLPGASLRGVPRLVDSLLGRNAEVFRSVQAPRANRLLVGDHSTVELQ